jgi:ribosome-associated translation inhibitor RaiA
MQIEINNPTSLLGENARSNAVAKIEAAFSRYLNRIKSVVVTARDLNGPRGGVDKQCQVLVSVSGVGDVVATAEHESLSRALNSAITSAQSAVNRKMQKSTAKKSRRRFAGKWN